MKIPQVGPTTRMFIGATLISTSAVWVRVADEVSPTAAGFYRMAFGVLALFMIAAARGLPMWRDWPYLFRMLPVGAFFALDLFLWHRSIHYVGPGLATVLVNLQVFVLSGVGVVFLGERVGWRFPLGLTLAVPGMFLLVGINFSDLPDNYQLGVALGIGTAFCYAGFLLGMRTMQRKADTLPPSANLMMASGWVAVLLALANTLEGGSFAIPNLEAGAALIVYGFLCQALGWFLLTRSMPDLPASIVGLLLLLQPALAMVWDVMFFGRAFGSVDLAASLLVLVGIYLASRRNRRIARIARRST